MASRDLPVIIDFDLNVLSSDYYACPGVLDAYQSWQVCHPYLLYHVRSSN